jgi:large subunit ribosomal protein L7Ae
MPPKAAPAAKKAGAVVKKPTGKGDKGSKAAAAKNPLIESRKRNFGIGGDVPPKRDLGRFVKWPKYVRLQRQKQVLQKRLKVPPSINQFTNTLSKNHATELFRLLNKYRPEDKATKKARLQAAAKAKAETDKTTKGDKPNFVKFGINHIAALVEKKKASLVVIAHDVEPIEVVVWLPALCRKMDIPYCIVKGKARLGAVVHKKTATALAFTNVKKDDAGAFDKLVQAVRNDFNGRHDEIRKRWGGGIMGMKTQHALAAMEKIKAKEALAKLG